ncbi:glycosyltransferase family 39 protein [Candidatus Roizmanbacteria bacterium]|nr:glycosyltransferase family 39 protein [Candidatus Roizmanbacteria bacterium]
MNGNYSKIQKEEKQYGENTNLNQCMKIFFWLKQHILLIGLIAFFIFLFFYHIDYSTLSSWDEGWYASIARDIIRSGSFLQMTWNGQPYYDHPPMGFWLMAISFKLLGVNEFSARIPSAILGLFTIILIYKTAVELFGKKIIGFVAGIILGTSVWYLIRVRSGNLESVFSFFYILTIFTSLKSSKRFRWFPLVMISFAGLMLSKTIVGFSAIIPIFFINLKQLLNRKNWNLVLKGTGLFLIIVLPWYLVQFFSYGDFYQHHFFNVGMRNKTFVSYSPLVS